MDSLCSGRERQGVRLRIFVFFFFKTHLLNSELIHEDSRTEISNKQAEMFQAPLQSELCHFLGWSASSLVSHPSQILPVCARACARDPQRQRVSPGHTPHPKQWINSIPLADTPQGGSLTLAFASVPFVLVSCKVLFFQAWQSAGCLFYLHLSIYISKVIEGKTKIASVRGAVPG